METLIFIYRSIMKKKVLLIICFISIILFIKFFVSDYEVSYKIDNFDVREKYSDGYYYLVLTNKDGKYNYVIKKNRSLFRKVVKSIKVDGECVSPKGFYTLCSEKDYLVTKDVLSNKFEYESKEKDFVFNNEFSDGEYVLIWKYDGFYYLNSNGYKSINIFNKDRYSNDLMIKINEYLIFPKYDDEYMFSGFIVLDMTSGKYKTIDTNYKFSYESYYAGVHKNKIYMYDKKNSELVEINYKKNKVKIVGDSFTGVFKYVKNKKVYVKMSEYESEKINFFDKTSNVLNVKGNMLSYKYDEELFTKYFNYEEVNIVDYINDRIYFIYKDNLYNYYEGKINYLGHYFEFNFNKNSNVFVYNK